MARRFLQTGTVLAPEAESNRYAKEVQRLPAPWVPPLFYLLAGSQAHATQAIKGAFLPPQLPWTLVRNLQAGAAWVGWEENGRPGPYFAVVQGQAILDTEGMGAVECGAIVPNTACRRVTATSLHPLRTPPACHCVMQTVPRLAPSHALTLAVWPAMLDDVKDWMTAPGTLCPPGPVLERLTAPKPSVRQVLHSAPNPTDQLPDEVLDLALEPLRVLRPPVLGAGGRGPSPAFLGRGPCGCGGARSTPELVAAGVAAGHTSGGCLVSLCAGSVVRRSPAPGCPPLGPATGVSCRDAVGAGVQVWGPRIGPCLACCARRCVPRRRQEVVRDGLLLAL